MRPSPGSACRPGGAAGAKLSRLLADAPHERPDVWLLFARDYLGCGLRRPTTT